MAEERLWLEERHTAPEGYWQHMNTAPMDGTTILAVDKDLCCAIIYWAFDPNSEEERWVSADGMCYGWTAFERWIPLPKMPKRTFMGARS